MRALLTIVTLGGSSLWRGSSSRLTPERPRDRDVAAVQNARAWLGYLACVAVIVANGPDKATLAGLLNGVWTAPVLKAAVALPCFLVGVALVAAHLETAKRPQFIWENSKPVLLVLGVTVAPFAVLIGGSAALSAMTNESQRQDLTPLLAVAGLLLLAALPAYFRVQYLAVKHTFRAADVHPMLPAIVGIGICGVGAVEGLRAVATSAHGVQRQLAWLNVGGALLLAALCTVELQRLRDRGVRLSGVYGRAATGRSTARSSRFGFGLLTGTVALVTVACLLAVQAFGRLERAMQVPPRGTHTLGVDLRSASGLSTTIRPTGHPRVERVEVSDTSVRLVVTYQNPSRKALHVLTCPRTESPTVPRLAWAAGATGGAGATDTYCAHHPLRKIIVRPGRRLTLWADFARTYHLGHTLTLSWYAARGTLRIG